MAMHASDEDDTPTPPPFMASHARRESSQLASRPPSKSPKQIQLLLIDSQMDDARRVVELFGETAGGVGIDVCHVESLAHGIRRHQESSVDLVLMDWHTCQSQGFSQLLKLHPGTGIIVLTTQWDPQVAIALLQSGAQDYLIKSQLTGNLLVRSVRFAMERERRRRAERELRAAREEFLAAREIQQQLFPKSAPSIPGTDIGGASFPADATGGDYFDYVPMLDGSYGVVVADVAGHGLGPALLMVEARAYLRALAGTRTSPGDILEHANQLLADDVSEDHFVTLFLGRLCPQTHTLTYASAGHPNGYVIDAGNNIKDKLGSTGLPLGLVRSGAYGIGPPIKLDPGDIVVLLTDGVYESASAQQERYGIRRVLDQVRDSRHLPAQQMVEELYEDIRNFCRTERQADDITTIIVKVLQGK